MISSWAYFFASPIPESYVTITPVTKFNFKKLSEQQAIEFDLHTRS